VVGGGGVLLGALAYLGAALVLRVEELQVVKRLLRRRLI